MFFHVQVARTYEVWAESDQIAMAEVRENPGKYPFTDGTTSAKAVAEPAFTWAYDPKELERLPSAVRQAEHTFDEPLAVKRTVAVTDKEREEQGKSLAQDRHDAAQRAFDNENAARELAGKPPLPKDQRPPDVKAFTAQAEYERTVGAAVKASKGKGKGKGNKKAAARRVKAKTADKSAVTAE